MRLYNGCPDDELQAVLDDNQAAKDEARKLGLILTYFPMEGAWMASRLEDYRKFSDFHPTPRAALNEAKGKL